MHMEHKRKVLIGAVSALVLAGGGAAVAQAVGGGEEAERSVTGAEADRATQAAVELVPGGDAQAVERDGEKGADWEVEVKKPDGTVVDVRLNASFEKVSIDSDSESADSEREGK
jgi:uncharacterized membrane protein YkoI